MGEDTITLTQSELDTRIQEAVDTATKDLISKHNGEMAKMRKENTDLKNASKTQEQLKQEQDEEINQELNDLRAFKRQTIIGEKLAKEGLPSHFKYDTRLINAKEEDFDKVLKDIKKDYEQTQPKGSQHSTIVQTTERQAQLSDKDKANQEFANALKGLVS